MAITRMNNFALNPKDQTFLPNPALPMALFGANENYSPTPVHQHIYNESTPLWVKDERSRLGLSAFKALGGIYAVSRLIQKYCLQHTGKQLDPLELLTPEARKLSASIKFVCASAGNHGLAVAKGAQMFGAHARVHLAKSVPETFAIDLRALGAQVIRSGDTYEQSVSMAKQDAIDCEGILLADGSWPGYLEPPALVMEGYTVIAEELRHQFTQNQSWPERVYLQAGVGGLAAAITYMIRKNWQVQPEITIIEPDAAPCLRNSVAAGQAVQVSGPESNMGRLDCKEPSLLALQVLSEKADRFIVVSDEQATSAADTLATFGLATSPSGAAGFAGACTDAAQSHESGATLVIVTEATR